MRKMIFVVSGAFVAAICILGASTEHASAAGNSLLPFWAQPYPTYFAYDPRQSEPASCYDWRTVEGVFGPKRVRVFICDSVVVERY